MGGRRGIRRVLTAKSAVPETIRSGTSPDVDLAELKQGTRRIVRWWLGEGWPLTFSWLRGHRIGDHLLNVANSQGRFGNVPQLGRSRIQSLLLFSGIRAEPDYQQVQHDQEGAIWALLERARNDLDCSPAGLNEDPDFVWGKRYETLRKYRGGWPSVVRSIVEQNEDVLPSSFYRRMSLGVWFAELTRDLRWWPPADRLSGERLIALLVEIVRAYYQHCGEQLDSLRYERMILTETGQCLFSAINERLRFVTTAKGGPRLRWGDLVERATGVDYRRIAQSGSGAYVLRQAQHRAQRGPGARKVGHPPLRSWPEFATDVVLGESIGVRWSRLHRHEGR